MSHNLFEKNRCAIRLLGLAWVLMPAVSVAASGVPQLILPRPHTLVATAHRVKVKAPKLVLPKPHTLVATVHRVKAKEPKLALPKPHTLVATATRKMPAGIALAGSIRDQGGAPISGADVSVTVGGKRYAGKSGKDGRYRIKLPGGVALPEMMTVSATKDGYKPGSVKVSKTFIRHADITLAKETKRKEKEPEAKAGDLVITDSVRSGDSFGFILKNVGKDAITDLELELQCFRNSQLVARGNRGWGIFLVLEPGKAVPLVIFLDRNPGKGELRYELHWKGRRIKPRQTLAVKGVQLAAEVGYGGYISASVTLSNPTHETLQGGWCYLGIYDESNRLILAGAESSECDTHLLPGEEKKFSTIMNSPLLDELHNQNNPNGSLRIWSRRVKSYRAIVYVSPPYE